MTKRNEDVANLAVNWFADAWQDLPSSRTAAIFHAFSAGYRLAERDDETPESHPEWDVCK